MAPVVTALVTGASRGIGRAVASAMIARGDRVIALGRDERALATLGAAHIVCADLAVPLARDHAIDEALAHEPTVLVQCAGVVVYEPFLETSDAALRAQLEVDLIAPFVVLQRFARALVAARSPGSVVHVASTLALRSAPDTSAYAAAKAGLLSLTRSAALELAPHAIRVNAVVPGVIDTDMVRQPRDVDLAALAALHPMGRFGTPDELAHAILHLCDAPFTTGSAYVVDGGLLAG